MKSKERAQKSRNTLFSCIMKKAVKIFSAIAIILVVLAIITFLLGYNYYKKQIGPVDKNSKEVIRFTVERGDTYYSIGPSLEEKGLIKSVNMYKIYLKLNKPGELKMGEFDLSPSLSVSDIVSILQGRGVSTDIVITFTEGKNMRNVAKVIATNTNNTEEDVYNLLKDKDYLSGLVDEYWFIDESILNNKLYYSLEGYLFPNTYNFINKNVTVKDIFKKLLDETGRQLEPYRTDIENSKYKIHEILTLASIVELEANTDVYRAEVAGVFYNRLNNKISLGSDVTTYYAAKVDMAERDLYQSEINDINNYNTRPTSFIGLPVGPICNPSISSIKAVLYPKKTNAFYFVSDNKGNIYFSKTLTEQNQTIAKLQKEGLWQRY